MSLSENNLSKQDILIIKRFNKNLTSLLAAYKDSQNQVIQLKKENEALKALLVPSQSAVDESILAKKQPPNSDLLNKINRYLKEIETCLAYFEEA